MVYYFTLVTPKTSGVFVNAYKIHTGTWNGQKAVTMVAERCMFDQVTRR